VGWAQIVDCATGAEGPGMSVEVGWSKDPNAKVNWSGGPVSGVIVRDRIHGIRLVAASAPPGLQPAGVPSAETAVMVSPSRNRFYALEWFSFAAIALIIYGLAVRNRMREEKK
jgi:cytochrome oxidase assembly protein ShyY1